MATAEIDAQYPLVKDVLSAGISVVDWNDFDYNTRATVAAGILAVAADPAGCAVGSRAVRGLQPQQGAQ